MTVHSPKTLRHIKAAWKHTKGLCQLLDSLEFMSLVTFYLENIERDQESEQQTLPEQNTLPVTKSFMALYPYRCPSFK